MDQMCNHCALNRTFRCLKYLNNGSLTMRYSIVYAMSNDMNLHVVIINCKAE